MVFGNPIRPLFIAFGDSITQFASRPDGFLSHVYEAFERKIDILNRGFSGFTTYEAVQMSDVFSQFGDNVKYITIFFGANDAAMKTSIQHVPLNLYEEYLNLIVSKAESICPNAKIIIISPPPVVDEKWVEYCQMKYPSSPVSIRTCDVTRMYSDVAVRVASTRGLRVIDTFKLMDNTEKESFFCDGLHLSPRGNEVLAEALIHELRILGAADEPMSYPEWGILEKKDFTQKFY